ncbi:MAG TPA: hypothetical protein VGB85_08300 [Nannocystis sp.]|jgi:hypothetical protein
MTSSWTTLRYREAYGAPGDDRAGHVEMTLWCDRRVRVAHMLARPAVFEGTLAEWVWPELEMQLRAAGFPTLSRPATAQGRGALLSTATENGALQMMWIWPELRKNVRLDRAVRVLEAIAHAASAGSLKLYRAIEREVLA